jgi:hypothetical protein
VRFYTGPEERVARLWPWTDVSPDPSREARRRAIETGVYGRCVYRCDNDVPDHQVLALDFEGGVTATFAMHGHGTRETRTIRVTGSLGELRGVLQDGVLEVTRHGSFHVEQIRIEGSPLGHSGGDDGLLCHFTDAVERRAGSELLASGRASLESHFIGFAAEQARESGRVVEIEEVRAAARRRAAERGR